MNSKSKRACSSQIPNIPSDYLNLTHFDISIGQSSYELIDDKKEVKQGRIRAILRQLDHHIQILDGYQCQQRKEQDKREVLSTELIEMKSILRGKHILPSVALKEEIDDRVELINNQVDIYNAQQDQIHTSDQPKTFLPLTSQQSTDCPLYVAVLVRHMDHVDPASCVGNESGDDEHD